MTSTPRAYLAAALDNGIRGRPRPLILLLEPTQRCNARCDFCYHWREECPAELTLPEIERLLAEAWDLGCRLLYLSGGEPTLYPDTEAVLALARRRGYVISMTTNGTSLATRLPRLAPYLDGVTVSLDYASSRHDEVRHVPGLFDRAVAGLERARRLHLPARINMSLHPGNTDQVEPLLELARRLSAGLHVRLLTRESRSLDITAFDRSDAAREARILLDLKRSNAPVLVTPAAYFRAIAEQRSFVCRPLSLLLTIDSSGRLFMPCPRHEGTKDRIAGNIREGALADLWHGPAAHAIRAEAARCTPTVDCYTSCILDIALLANLDGAMVVEQLLAERSLLAYFTGRRS